MLLKNQKYLVNLIFFYNHAYSDVINNIEVKNNDRITKESIITFSGIELGKDYSQDQLNDILSDLYETNFFSDINSSTQSLKGFLIHSPKRNLFADIFSFDEN